MKLATQNNDITNNRTMIITNLQNKVADYFSENFCFAVGSVLRQICGNLNINLAPRLQRTTRDGQTHAEGMTTSTGKKMC